MKITRFIDAFRLAALLLGAYGVIMRYGRGVADKYSMPGCVVFAYFTIVTCHRLVTHELPDGFDPDTSWSGVAAAFVLVYGSAASGEVEPGTLAAGFMVGLVWFVAGLSAINVRRRLVAGPAHTKVNMAGKLCVVTGANAGVGLDTARELAKLGAEVVLACRSEVKATAAMLEIKSSFPKANVRFVKLDIGSLDSVRGCASQLLDAGVPIDVLINNAGVMLTELKKSSDRIDLAFQANRLGHFLLTTMLIPLLLKRQGRVVNVTSAIHRIPHKVDLNEVAQRNGKFPGMFEVYAETKLCNILFTAALNRQYGSTDSNVARIKAFAVHPGTVITTNVARDLPPWIVYLNECSLPFMKLVTKAWKEVTWRRTHIWQKSYGGSLSGNKGAQITVEDVFYNVPTRRKALSSTADEFARIYEVVSRYAIHNAGVAFSLKKHGETTAAVRTTSSATQADNIRTVFGSTVANELLEIGAEDEPLKFKMKGLVSNANYNVKRATFILFINHRLVNSPAIKKALDQVYAAYLPKGTHSFMYLSLEIHPGNIDVNVHPTKMQVHFLHEDSIIEKIQESLSDKLLGANASRTFFTQTLLPGVDDPSTSGNGGSGKALSGDGAAGSKQGGSVGGKSSKVSRTRSSDGGPRVYDHDLVRTDSRSQTLHAFLNVAAENANAGGAGGGGLAGPAIQHYSASSSGKTSRAALQQGQQQHQQQEECEEDDWDPIRQRPRKKKRTTQPPPAAADEPKEGGNLADVANANGKGGGGSQRGGSAAAARGAITWPCSNTRLSSVEEIRTGLDRNEHKGLREVFRDHIFVGCIDHTRALLQHKTKMYVTQTKVLCKELFYQLAIRGFSEFNTITLSPPAPLYDLALAGLSRPGSCWTEEDGPKEALARAIADSLLRRGPMLDEYFAIRINDDCELCTLPLLLDECAPALSGLPDFIVRFGREVNWESEKDCFDSIAREIGAFYQTIDTDALDSEAGAGGRNDADAGGMAVDAPSGGSQAGSTASPRGSWRWMVEHRIYPAFRGMFQPPKNLSTDAAIVQIADLHQLYKIFERC